MLQFCLATMAWTPARHPVHKGKDQDGKCRFVSFFEPVAIASMQESSVGATVRYRTLAVAIASNCIYALHNNNNIITMPTCDVLLRHFCKMSLTVRICGCILLSLTYSCLHLMTFFKCPRYLWHFAVVVFQKALMPSISSCLLQGFTFLRMYSFSS